MKITTRGRYALRAILAMARLGSDGSPVSITSLSEEEDISSVFLEQIFFRLRRAGIVSSVRGPGGGFCFARPLGSLTIKNILDAAGEKLECTFCKKNVIDCPRKSFCLSHGIFLEVSSLVNAYLEATTLESILEKKDAEPLAANQ